MQGEHIDIKGITVSRHAWIPSTPEWARLTEKNALGGWSEAIYRLVGIPPPHEAHSPTGESFVAMKISKSKFLRARGMWYFSRG